MNSITAKAALTAVLATGLMLGIAPDDARAQTTLKFISWQVDERGYGDWWGQAIAEFEATHPDVKIEFTKVGRDEYADTVGFVTDPLDTYPVPE